MARPPAIHEYVVISAGVTVTPTAIAGAFPFSNVNEIQSLEAMGWEVVNCSFGDGWGGPPTFGENVPVFVFLRREL